MGSSHTQERYERGITAERLWFAHPGQERQQRRNVPLRRMFAYSATLRMIVILGLLQAVQSACFFGETVCDVGLHRNGDALAALGKLSKELTSDHAEAEDNADFMRLHHAGCEAVRCSRAQTSVVEPPPLGCAVGGKTWQL